jgi:hypothetical protein
MINQCVEGSHSPRYSIKKPFSTKRESTDTTHVERRKRVRFGLDRVYEKVSVRG